MKVAQNSHLICMLCNWQQLYGVSQLFFQLQLPPSTDSSRMRYCQVLVGGAFLHYEHELVYRVIYIAENSFRPTRVYFLMQKMNDNWKWIAFRHKMETIDHDGLRNNLKVISRSLHLSFENYRKITCSSKFKIVVQTYLERRIKTFIKHKSPKLTRWRRFQIILLRLINSFLIFICVLRVFQFWSQPNETVKVVSLTRDEIALAFKIQKMSQRSKDSLTIICCRVRGNVWCGLENEFRVFIFGWMNFDLSFLFSPATCLMLCFTCWSML